AAPACCTNASAAPRASIAVKRFIGIILSWSFVDGEPLARLIGEDDRGVFALAQTRTRMWIVPGGEHAPAEGFRGQMAALDRSLIARLPPFEGLDGPELDQIL